MWFAGLGCHFCVLRHVLGFAEVGGALARFATEVAAEGGLVDEAEEVGYGLHAEVTAGVEQHFGFGDDACVAL